MSASSGNNLSFIGYIKQDLPITVFVYIAYSLKRRKLRIFRALYLQAFLFVHKSIIYAKV